MLKYMVFFFRYSLSFSSFLHEPRVTTDLGLLQSHCGFFLKIYDRQAKGLYLPRSADVCAHSSQPFSAHCSISVPLSFVLWQFPSYPLSQQHNINILLWWLSWLLKEGIENRTDVCTFWVTSLKTRKCLCLPWTYPLSPQPPSNCLKNTKKWRTSCISVKEAIHWGSQNL